VEVRQFFFPQWKALLDNGTPLKVSASAENGLIRVYIPSGKHNVLVYLIRSQSEVVGAMMTSVTFLVLAIVVLYDRASFQKSA